ncbi:MAG TPA: PIN domain-containing protein [Methylovirgula sp.]|nr:PIN domain-containing protein [Methylovirgula sp.]
MSGAERCFFDTNVLLYLVSSDGRKADRAEALLAKGGILSVQVLNEFASVALRKQNMLVTDVREVLAVVRALCKIVPVSLEAHDAALGLSERLGFSFYDSLIVAAAELARCTLLYTEDMQHGQVIGGLRICDPFREP